MLSIFTAVPRRDGPGWNVMQLTCVGVESFLARDTHLRGLPRDVAERHAERLTARAFTGVGVGVDRSSVLGPACPLDFGDDDFMDLDY